MISLIAAIDEAGGLGKNNQLLCHLPADLQHFKKITLGKPIIMGRSTFESIGRPLPGRLNIVLTKNKSSIEGVTIANSLQQAMDLVRDVQEVMIIGGANLFEQTIHQADYLYLTVIHHTFEADVFFPKINITEWKQVETSFKPKDEKNLYDMTFITYKKEC